MFTEYTGEDNQVLLAQKRRKRYLKYCISYLVVLFQTVTLKVQEKKNKSKLKFYSLFNSDPKEGQIIYWRHHGNILDHPKFCASQQGFREFILDQLEDNNRVSVLHNISSTTVLYKYRSVLFDVSEIAIIQNAAPRKNPHQRVSIQIHKIRSLLWKFKPTLLQNCTP